jgi:hypothetical protein
MPRLYRYVALAAFGCLISAAAPHEDGNRDNQKSAADHAIEQSLSTIARSSVEAVKVLQAPKDNRPCQPGKDDHQSELCAQWKAADTAGDAALWAMLGAVVAAVGTFGLYWQIVLTRRAVEDTGKATEAMWEANRITNNTQRAWLSLSIEPEKATTARGEDLYFRVNFIAENVGSTEATHYMAHHAVFFLEENETARDLSARMQAQVDNWLLDLRHIKTLTVPPGERVLYSWWDSRTPPDFNWRSIDGIIECATPYFLFAAFYRTISDPEMVQMVWRAWAVFSLDKAGEVRSWIEKGVFLGPGHLKADPFTISAHHATCAVSVLAQQD